MRASMPDPGAKAGRDPRVDPSDSPTDFGVEYTPTVSADFPEQLKQRYECLGELGRGGMGVVYRVRDRETSELIALKVLRPEIAANAEMNERFRTELRLARQITHKNVCRIYDLNRFGDVACISMELVKGESLRAVLERFTTLSTKAATRVVTQVCEAMLEAHRLGIVHRDLKPENVMIDAEGSVKVMDFGIAISAGSHDGEVSGTPAYMSPEQIEGKPTDPRSDVYAIGLLLYECLTGWLPFEGATARERAKNTLTQLPRSPRELEPTIPEHIEHAVLRCLQRDPEQRYGDARKLAEALRSQDAAVHEEVVVPERVLRWTAGDWVLLVLGALSLAVFALLWPMAVPALNYPLESDALTARRSAQEIFKGLKLNPVSFRVTPNYDADSYREEVAYFLVPKRENRVAIFHAVRAIELPIGWHVEYTTSRWGEMVDASDGSMELDRRGSLKRYELAMNGGDRFIPTYHAPSIEERRKIAADVVLQSCGTKVDGVPRVEYSGGEFGASYSATWQPIHPPGSPPTARVKLWAERPIGLECPSAFPPLMEFETMPPVPKAIFNLTPGAVVFLILMGVAWFVVGQMQSSSLLAKRAPAALLLGLCSGWLIPAASANRNLPYVVQLVAGTVIAALVWEVVLVAFENRARRVRPETLATWTEALNGRVLSRGVGLGVLRGVLLGTIVAGVQALVAITGFLSTMNLEHRGIGFVMFGFLGIPDPSSAALALNSRIPVLYVVASAVLNAMVISFAGFGYGLGSNAKWLTDVAQAKSKTMKALHASTLWFGIALVPALLAAGLRLSFGQSISFGMGSVFVPWLLCCMVSVGFFRYDLLTAALAVATTTVLTLNSNLIALSPERSNPPAVALFVLWGALTLASVAAVFREPVKKLLDYEKSELR